MGDQRNQVQQTIKGNPSQYVKLNIGGRSHEIVFFGWNKNLG